MQGPQPGPHPGHGAEAGAKIPKPCPQKQSANPVSTGSLLPKSKESLLLTLPLTSIRRFNGRDNLGALSLGRLEDQEVDEVEVETGGVPSSE